MRTLLTDFFPPQSANEQTFSPLAQPVTGKLARTFPQTAVLASMDNLVEVGVVGTAIATPGASPADAPERGVADFLGRTLSAEDVCSSSEPAAVKLEQSPQNA